MWIMLFLARVKRTSPSSTFVELLVELTMNLRLVKEGRHRCYKHENIHNQGALCITSDIRQKERLHSSVFILLRESHPITSLIT